MLYGIGSYEKIMKILVTGGCGFIGSHFIEEMIKRDDVEKITNLDCLTSVANRTPPFDTDEKYHVCASEILAIAPVGPHPKPPGCW